MSDLVEKKTTQILLRLPESLGSRLDAASEVHHRGRQVIIRDGLVSELDRLDAKAGLLTSDESRLIAEAKRLGIDIPALLRRELKQVA